MEQPVITTDKILFELKKAVEEKKIIDKDDWLTIAFKLNSLLIDENKRLYDLEQKVAQMKLGILKGQDKRNVAAVELEVQASDLYREMREQDAKVSQVIEFIRIAKKRSDTF